MPKKPCKSYVKLSKITLCIAIGQKAMKKHEKARKANWERTTPFSGTNNTAPGTDSYGRGTLGWALVGLVALLGNDLYGPYMVTRHVA